MKQSGKLHSLLVKFCFFILSNRKTFIALQTHLLALSMTSTNILYLIEKPTDNYNRGAEDLFL